MNEFTRKEKIVAILICLMKRNDDGEFQVCKWNDFLIELMNKTRIDTKEFARKLFSSIP